MPVVFEHELADSYFYGCLVPWRRAPFPPEVAHSDYMFLTKHLWASTELRFLTPKFFAVPGLGRLPKVERPVVLFGGFFLELEENLPAFLDEFESVLAKLHWHAVHAHLRGSRTGTFDLSWVAHETRQPRDYREPPPSAAWDFTGPRQIALPPSRFGATKQTQR